MDLDPFPCLHFRNEHALVFPLGFRNFISLQVTYGIIPGQAMAGTAWQSTSKGLNRTLSIHAIVS